MKKYYLVLAVGFFILGACQKDEMVEESAELELVPEEYFRAEVDGVHYKVTDPEAIGGTVYPSYESGIINFDFFAEINDGSSDSDLYKSFTFKVCFYDGPGTYQTGTNKTVSWAGYWEGWNYWEDNYAYDTEPGEVTVTEVTGDFVEGTFEFEAYSEDTETTISVIGEFGLLLEAEEDYYSE